MKPTKLASTLALSLGLVASQTAAAGEKTVRVDCAKGESINAALEDKADPLVIEIIGVCEEEVIVRRDFVTLRGAEPGTTVVGPQIPTIPFGGGITVDGADGVVLTDLLLRDGRRGVTVRGGGGVSLERVTLRNHGATGLSVFGTSSVTLTDCVAESNNRFGIAIWESSSLELRGTVSATQNGLVGLLLSTSHASASSLTESIELDDNLYSGLFMQIGATAQMSVSADGNQFAGVYMLATGNYSGGIEASGNIFGVALEGGPRFSASGTIADNGCFAVYSESDSTFAFSGTISNNPCGLVLDGTEARFSEATVSDPVSLSFGTTVDFAGGNTFSAGISCDETVLTRGDAGCPPPLALHSLGSKAALASVLDSRLASPVSRPFRREE